MFPTTKEIYVKKMKFRGLKTERWSIVQCHKWTEDHQWGESNRKAGEMTDLGEIVLKTFNSKKEAQEALDSNQYPKIF